MVNHLQNKLDALYEQYREYGSDEFVLIKSLSLNIELIKLIDELLSVE